VYAQNLADGLTVQGNPNPNARPLPFGVYRSKADINFANEKAE